MPSTPLRPSLLALALTLTLSDCPGQTPRQLLDINQTPVSNPGSQSGWFATLGGTTCFAASDPVHGSELWRTDGTTPGTVLLVDLVPGAVGSQPVYLTATTGMVFFLADTGGGHRLWRTDGTAAGTIAVPGAPEQASNLLAVGPELWFTGRDAAHGTELWRTDGTAQGTRVVELLPGPTSSQSRPLGAAGGHVYFTGSSANQPGLWRVDTATGAVALVRAWLQEAQVMAVAGGALYFGARGPELWKSDGTPAGTAIVRRWNTGPGYAPRHLTALGADLYLVIDTDDYSGQAELWRIDGRSGAQQQLANGLSLGPLATLGGQVVFTLDGDAAGLEPWITDGTPGGTRRLADLRPGSEGSAAAVVATLGGDVILAADDGQNGRELWRTNGTPSGTRLVTDIAPGTAGCAPSHIHADPAGARLYLSADDTVHGAEPHTYSFAAGARLLADVWPPSPGTRDADPRLPVRLFGITLFIADDGVHGAEPWRTDGTAQGTSLVADLVPGPVGSSPREMCVLGGVAMLASGSALWRTDGTAAGTSLVRDLHGSSGIAWGPQELTAVGRTLYFAGDDGQSGPELWRSDGTPQGTTLVADLLPGTAGIAPRALLAVGDTLLFVADDGQTGAELWRSDGTPLGTHLVADLVPGSGGSTPSALVAFGAGLLFRATTPATGQELFRSDGTAAGTHPVRDIVPGPTGSGPGDLTVAGDLLFFRATDGVHGSELWVSDGTAAGTRLVLDAVPGPAGSNPSGMTAVGNRVVFRASDASGRSQPWISDGSAAGTHPVAAALAASLSSAGPFRASGDRYVWFRTANATLGGTLWRTDGTLAGTVPLVSEVGRRGGYTIELGSGELLFAADDGLHGLELWTVDPGASSVAVGQGCGSGLRVPSLRPSDPVLGSTLLLRGDGTPSATTGVVAFGTPVAPIAVLGCDWYLGRSFVALPAFATSQPSWQQAVPIPGAATLAGARASVQAFFGPLPGPRGLEASNALHLQLGR